MSDLADELSQVAEVVEYLQEHPAVVPQSVTADVSSHDYSDATVHLKFLRADEEENDE